jgi:hypothetical protein
MPSGLNAIVSDFNKNGIILDVVPAQRASVGEWESFRSDHDDCSGNHRDETVFDIEFRPAPQILTFFEGSHSGKVGEERRKRNSLCEILHVFRFSIPMFGTGPSGLGWGSGHSFPRSDDRGYFPGPARTPGKIGGMGRLRCMCIF